MTANQNSEAGFGVYSPRSYPVRVALSLYISVFAAVRLLESVFRIIFTGDMMVQTLLLSVIALSLGILLLLETVNTLLIISADGIEYRRIGYTILASWSDIQRVELRLHMRGGSRYVLVLRNSVVKGSHLQRRLLRLGRRDLIIPLAAFDYNWHKTDIGRLIGLRAQVKVPN